MFDVMSFFQGVLLGASIATFFFLLRRPTKIREYSDFSDKQLYLVWLDAWRYIIFLLCDQEWSEQLEKYSNKRAEESFRKWYQSLYK